MNTLCIPPYDHLVPVYAPHRRLEVTRNLDDVLIEHNIRIHTLAGALQSKLLNIIVRVSLISVDAMLDGKHQLREYCSAMVTTKTPNPIEENSALNLAAEPINTQTEAHCNERRLTVRHTIRVNLILHCLHSIINGLTSTQKGKCLAVTFKCATKVFVNEVVAFGDGIPIFKVERLRLMRLETLHASFGHIKRISIREIVLGIFQELAVILLRVLRHMLIKSIGCLTTVLVTGNVLDYLSNLGSRHTNGIRRTHGSIAQLETIIKHIPEIRQGAIRLTCER